VKSLTPKRKKEKKRIKTVRVKPFNIIKLTGKNTVWNSGRWNFWTRIWWTGNKFLEWIYVGGKGMPLSWNRKGN